MGQGSSTTNWKQQPDSAVTHPGVTTFKPGLESKKCGPQFENGELNDKSPYHRESDAFHKPPGSKRRFKPPDLEQLRKLNECNR